MLSYAGKVDVRDLNIITRPSKVEHISPMACAPSIHMYLIAYEA